MSLPPLNQFLFDRVWLKAYPSFFSNLRLDENKERFREYQQDRLFEKMTDNAFRLYRTLDCVRRAHLKGMKLEELGPDDCAEIRKYGVHDVWPFEVRSDIYGARVIVRRERESFEFKLQQVDSLRFYMYAMVRGDRLSYEKAIYLEYEPYLRVMVKPYLDGFIPPMVRVFYNPLILTKETLRVRVPEGYESEHENWVLPEIVSSEFIKVNHEMAFNFRFLLPFVRKEWVKWFGVDDELTVKVTQVELCRDVDIPKVDLVASLHVLGGRSKTLKASAVETEGAYTWTESGLKYYVTVKRGLQVKVYTKAWSAQRVLNRLEFTVNVNRPLGDVNAEDVMRFVRRQYEDVSKALLKGDRLQRLMELLRPFVRCRDEELCDRHYAFLLDLFSSGQIKGTSYYRDIARVYTKEGFVKVKGRGRNSAYVLNENAVPFLDDIRERIVEILGVSLEELKLQRIDVVTGKPKAALSDKMTKIMESEEDSP